jgi:CRISPR-associated protein Cmr1
MPKKVPDCPMKPTPPQGAGKRLREYRIRLVTPMFGGGVDPGTPDRFHPIRATAIRGQLQFWWRATRGATCQTIAELHERHATVWGTTETASPVEVRVTTEPVVVKPCARYGWSPAARGGQGAHRLDWLPPFDRNPNLTYALFPFQGQAPEGGQGTEPKKRPAEFIENASFTLALRFPENLRADVHMAVWAWVNFGGIGARTRRGCGTLYCDELAPKSVAEMSGWLQANAGPTCPGERQWPTLPSWVAYRPEVGPSLDVWDWLMGFWKHFRQGEGFARNPGQQPNRPGRSRYPEPEAIRRITRKRAPQHARLPHIPDDAFPRAELGLPIVFHYQGRGEPGDTVLYPSAGANKQPRDRMASPVILKPVAVGDGRTAVPLILCLNTSGLSGIDLREGSTSLPLPTTVRVRAAYKGSPLEGLSASGSTIEAFVALAKHPDFGFQEVTR